MTQEQYTLKTARRKGSHLTEAEMNQIEAYKKVGLSNRQIALRIGCSHQTINNGNNLNFNVEYSQGMSKEKLLN